VQELSSLKGVSPFSEDLHWTPAQSSDCLEFLPEKLEEDIADQRGDHGNFKISRGKHVSEGPRVTPFFRPKPDRSNSA
jgi:hypothetical protein